MNAQNPNTLKSIAVYCGSNLGARPEYHKAAQQMGQALAQRDMRLVYGGGNIGLMGTVADTVLEQGGEVVGVIPTFLVEKEVAHQGLSELIETTDMATRKYKMIELADGFIALAGGLGTFEELYEVLSLAQLRLHAKPIGVLNTHGFFDPVIATLQKAADEGFMPHANLSLLCVSDDPDELLEMMANYRFIDAPKWTRPTWLDTSPEKALHHTPKSQL
ncbi:Rossman fold protein, TIGR00730 family [Moraxella caviae]|uniref:Cytokinin riboside 5'-monophosphate phosphoribohydrolase n=1 Tax=Moraxella caviae TaxID=34060 RepID=A0A1T0A3E9_9GAMM|nr:TIGR00730 family Rossman fold protein [Moraxella caviae]OOR90079.1 Rossman fold protein, TIGR00730 family [Moraxella caviae]STZ14695.1 LOG family protein yvdD [Moraxella caviae]VEW12885.1 LOG family protein yvdD [Moraxella caviae]